MGKKVIRQLYFKEYDNAKEFVWASLGYKVRVKDVEYGENDIYTVTVKGREENIRYLSEDFDKWLEIKKTKEDSQKYKEIRRRTAVLANALACREALMVYLLNKCYLGKDDIANVEDVIDPVIIDLAHELMKDRPGPSGAIADAYMKMVSDVHEGD